MGAEPVYERVTADTDGEVVVFLIGMRINRFRSVRSWWPAFRAMPRMLKELTKDPDSGLLHHILLTGNPRTYYVVQYWESKEKLFAYASRQESEHRPAWAAFNRAVRAGNGRVGIWHETYSVPAGHYENIYFGMPPAGLGAAYGTVPVGRRGERAAQRLAAAGKPAGEAA
ncbi:hypothetical protein SRB5_23130 [Streptomyces sp. RB5]|uniref:DUF4188 domain-containing protein n=1 Tax=Streptomyces smaragdinus TaxID=2585196 RepID=A0A7K0CFN5_9ACTN|nr:DUF4188 domain-containing protein [Streptomyces smaragdinus]MQY12183.1 hypothetical protein [Streptomyces smaragdinus]